MPPATDTKPLTAVFQLRADPQLLEQVRALARRRQVSANRFLVEAVRDALEKDREREWREGFEAMGRDPDTDAEYLLPAAREVLFGN